MKTITRKVNRCSLEFYSNQSRQSSGDIFRFYFKRVKKFKGKFLNASNVIANNFLA